ncbi:MAG TPA: GNAT family N-acetyltransferase [Noviherbaspirillum sp.]|nr:GNAT family N-acetyltransferase [Noviherbaspirillum sp.]
MKLRSAHAGDAEKLAKLFEQLGYACSTSELVERMASRVNSHNEIFVAEISEDVVGVVVFNIVLPVHESGKWCVVSALVVDESVRGKGIGAALLAHVKLHAMRLGCTQIELSSNESRKEAHAFYESNGFAEKRKRFVRMLGA